MRYILPVVILLVITLVPRVSFTQSNKGELRGTLLDEKTKEALPYATVAVYTARDTAMVTFRMSDEKGRFKVPGLPVNQQLRVVITMMSFKVYRKEFTLASEQPVLELGDVKMEQSNSMLGEVVIVAEIPPVLVKNDTLEFNAASFKTLPTSLVEDLLKKLPGVAVDASGNITVNGKVVHKILVDGKEFFGSDPKIASRNLPADVIDKIQVLNDPEALRRDPDLPEMEIPQVINLTFKKGIKKGMFGKLYGGAGTQDRYEGGGIINAFRDTTQISVLGYSNNLSRPGFGIDDVRKIGGFDRSGFNSIMIRSDGGYALNGVSFGATGEGIQQSTGGGANFNTVTKSGLKLNLQYFYGDINADVDQLVNSSQSLESDTLNTRRSVTRNSRSQTHQVGGKLEWKLDTLTTLIITPSLSFTRRTADQEEFTYTFRDTRSRINESDNNELLNEDDTSISSEFSLNRLFTKKGRVFNLNGSYGYSTTLQSRYNTATNTFFGPQPETTELNQLRDTDDHNTTFRSAVSYTEPLIKDLSADIRVNSEYFNDKNVISTYTRDVESGEYDQPEDELSNMLDREGWRNYITTGLKWKAGKLTLQPSVRFTALDIESVLQDRRPIKQEYFYIYPSLNVRWNNLNLSYNVNLREPDATDLQPVTDNTNPLFIRYGNPELTPTISHTFNVSLYKFDMKKSLNYNFFVYGSISEDAVTRQRTVEANGVQTSRPVNTDGNWAINGSASANKDFKYDSGRQFSIGGSLRSSYNKTLIILNETQSYSQVWGIVPSVNAGFNLNDKVEFSQSLSLNFQQSSYENNLFTDRSIINRISKTGVVLRMPGKVVWEANYEDWYNSNAAPGLQNSYGRLNAGVTFLFMKNDRAQLKLSVYDLLDQNLSAYRVIRENLVEDYQTMALNRYGLLTFTYNIRNFGGKVGSTGTNSIFRF